MISDTSLLELRNLLEQRQAYSRQQQDHVLTIPSRDTSESFGQASTSREAHQLIRLLFGAGWFNKGYRVKECGFTYRIIKATR
jgi:hypothetical protein